MNTYSLSKALGLLAAMPAVLLGTLQPLRAQVPVLLIDSFPGELGDEEGDPDRPIIAPYTYFDTSGDALDDVWQTRFGAFELSAGEDTDGDGLTNFEESEAGTDPTDPRSRFRIEEVAFSRESFDDYSLVTFEGVAGKAYEIDETHDLVKWIKVWGDPHVAESDGPVTARIPRTGEAANRLYRVRVSDIDSDNDSVPDYQELSLNFSRIDGTYEPLEAIVAADVANWLELSSPGTDPDGAQANLQEVEVATIRESGAVEPALLVTATGTGTWHRLTSWRVGSDGTPIEVASLPPIDGHRPKILCLTPDLDSDKNFVTARIRNNGELWLSSRALASNGIFRTYDSRGYGAHTKVLSYTMAQRPIWRHGTIDHYQVVTAAANRPHGSNFVDNDFTVIAWTIDAETGAIASTDMTSDFNLISLPDHDDPSEAKLDLEHLGGARYVLTYTTTTSRVEDPISSGGLWDDTRHLQGRHFFRVGSDGNIHHEGGGWKRLDSRGREIGPACPEDNTDIGVLESANAAGSLGDDGFVTASVTAGGTTEMRIFERRLAEDGSTVDAYEVTQDALDMIPGHGVYVAPPQLNDTWLDRSAPGDQVGRAVAVGDFNGDGYKDVAIGAPNREVGDFSRAGAVYIIHGSSDGITDRDYDQVWTQDSDGIGDAAEDGDLFGYSFAVGDFNGDNLDDLAISAVGEDVGSTVNRGKVHVLYGTVFGLSAAGSDLFGPGSIGVTAEDYGYFGWALAAGDFEGTGYDQLAISMPGKDIGGHVNAGAVYVLRSDSNGLTTTRHRVLHQDLPELWTEAQDYDQFGYALAVGNFNGDSYDDLAIAIPYENIGSVEDAGAVQVVPGGASDWGPDVFISQNGFRGGGDISGACEAGDHFGFSIVAGDFNNDGADDLGIGVPGEGQTNAEGAGVVHVINGTIFGLHPINNLMINEDRTFSVDRGNLPSGVESNESFGCSLASGDFNGDGITDLVVGASNENVDTVDDAGAVFLLPGSNDGLQIMADSRFHQNSTRQDPVDPDDPCPPAEYEMAGAAQSGDDFGFSLAAGDFNADGNCDLVAGIPFEDRTDATNCGSVQLMPGSDDYGFDVKDSEVWYVRRREEVRGMVTDLALEEAGGPGAGKLFAHNEHLPWRQVASVTKIITLLLTVEALESGQVSLSDEVLISELAGKTGGSKLGTYRLDGTEKKDSGKEIPFVQEGDCLPLVLLIHGMMNQSCNRSSVAIGEHVATALTGDPSRFLEIVADRLDDLGLTPFTVDPNDTGAVPSGATNPFVFGHPAGGFVCRPQQLITILREGYKHPLFIDMGGRQLYDSSVLGAIMSGEDSDGMPKVSGPIPKMATIGSYPGRVFWKGGNGRLWWKGSEDGWYPNFPDPPVSPNVGVCEASAVAIVERMGRSFAMALMQTGKRTADSQSLLDAGLQRTFTPDLCATRTYPETGDLSGSGVSVIGSFVGSEGPLAITNFALDRITGNTAVTAVINNHRELQLDTWILDPTGERITHDGTASTTLSLRDRGDEIQPRIIDMSTHQTPESIADFLSATLVGQHLELKLWRVGEGR